MEAAQSALRSAERRTTMSIKSRIRGPKRVTMCVGAVAVALGTSALLYPPTASAKLPWNEQKYVECVQLNLADDKDLSRFDELSKACCEDYSGTWDAKKLKCEPPPAKPQDGQRSFPGTVMIPPDLRNAPAVTEEPPRPVEVPSGSETVAQEGNSSPQGH
jgi:hypothetical protein